MAAITIEVPAKITLENGTLVDVRIDIGGDQFSLGETYIPLPTSYDTLIGTGLSLSEPIDLATSEQRCARPVAIRMPTSWTSANLTFQVSVTGSTYFDMYDDAGNEYTVAAGASRFISLSPADFAGVRFIKIRSGTTGSPVNQGADRTVVLVAAR